MPVCVSDGSGGYAPAAPAMRAIDHYYAAAWHQQSNDAWIDSKQLGSKPWTGVTCRIVKVIDSRVGGLERVPIL